MTPEESRFHAEPEELVEELRGLPAAWTVGRPDPDDPGDVRRLTELLREHERAGRGWPGAGKDDVLVEVRGLRTRENVVVRDDRGLIRAWGSVHDRASGRMLFVHVVERGIDERIGRACSDLLVEWAVGRAREVGAARGLEVQQVDTGAFDDDERQHRWLAAAGFTKVRRWWQMERPVTPDEAALVDDPARWERDGVVFRLVERDADGQPAQADLRAVHDVLEAAFSDHFNSKPETFDEFLFRLREDPGHGWDHWWLAEVDDRPGGALVGTGSASGSYVAYIGVVEVARGRGVAKGLLRTIIADTARRGGDRVGLEVDADSPTGADRLYRGLGWTTSYVTESWHRDVPVRTGV
ncbi:MAG TPA: GNAT family N-acetyltransferase [Nocardioides sp.]|uniref:GNAT family N-acetyltransferase n=1 Tax=Nocardioides sp. TaxID=35761 RepID=UPI002E2F2291|nr:GNAT family N-acetyltransferase [Nocardioides sp.]HEX5089526.1 GNAT family N-acetyltransferase [Nocardioides sp.]